MVFFSTYCLRIYTNKGRMSQFLKAFSFIEIEKLVKIKASKGVWYYFLSQ